MHSRIVLILLGGGFGSLCRYLFGQIAERWLGAYAWGTLGVNLLGCLLIGCSFGLAERNVLHPHMRLFLMTGFLGGLTTFSSYALETSRYLENGNTSYFLMHLFANNLGGIALVFAGLTLTRIIVH